MLSRGKFPRAVPPAYPLAAHVTAWLFPGRAHGRPQAFVSLRHRNTIVFLAHENVILILLLNFQFLINLGFHISLNMNNMDFICFKKHCKGSRTSSFLSNLSCCNNRTILEKAMLSHLSPA